MMIIYSLIIIVYYYVISVSKHMSILYYIPLGCFWLQDSLWMVVFASSVYNRLNRHTQSRLASGGWSCLCAAFGKGIAVFDIHLSTYSYVSRMQDDRHRRLTAISFKEDLCCYQHSPSFHSCKVSNFLVLFLDKDSKIWFSFLVHIYSSSVLLYGKFITCTV